MSSLGDRLLFVNPGSDNGGGQRGVAVRPLTLATCDAIAREVSGVEAVVADRGRRVTAVYGNSHWSVTVTGITADVFLGAQRER